MPLILSQNEATEWGHSYADVLGEQYEFPSRYRRLMSTGERFIYYRGRRRAEGGTQPQAYLGAGVLGPSVLKANGLFEARIASYEQFNTPVYFKVGAAYLESSAANYGRRAGLYFRSGVREVSDQVFERILEAAKKP